MSNFENQFIKILENNHIKYQREKTYKDLKFGYYRFDFFLPETGILVEIDGPQHYKFTKIFYKNRTDFLKSKERDRCKNNYCLAHNIPLYRIPYWELDSIVTYTDFTQDKFRVKSQYHNDHIKCKIDKNKNLC